MVAPLDLRRRQFVKASFPLAALALLITAFAALLACADVERWNQQYTWLSVNWPWRLVAIFGAAAGFGGVVGFVLMTLTKERWRMRLAAALVGMMAGAVGALLLIAPGPIWRTVFAMLILLSTAIIFRLGSK